MDHDSNGTPDEFGDGADVRWLSALTDRYVTGLVVLALVAAVVSVLRKRR